MSLRIIKDIQQRLFCSPTRIVLPLIILMVLLFQEQLNIEHLLKFGFEGKPSIGDLYVSLFWGMMTYVPGDHSFFQIPFNWMILMIGFAYASADLITKELETNGIMIILQSGKRSRWIINRYIVGISIVLLLFAMIIIGCMTGAILSNGSIQFGITEYTAQLQHIQVEEKSVLIIYILPIVSIITLCVLQITMELMSNSIFGFIFIISIEVLSCFYTSVFIPGNGAILARGILGENSIEPFRFIVTCILICIISVRIGWVSFYKRDLLGRLV